MSDLVISAPGGGAESKPGGGGVCEVKLGEVLAPCSLMERRDIPSMIG